MENLVTLRLFMANQRIDTTYFVESRAEIFTRDSKSRPEFLEKQVFTEPVLQELQASKAGIALASEREEDGIASIVQELNIRNIPTSLWLNEKENDGYWHSKRTIDAAEESTDHALNWIDRSNLKIDRIGLDNEVPLKLMGALINGRIKALLQTFKEFPVAKDGQNRLEKLIELINQKYGVEFYKLPILGDIGLIKKILGLFDIPENLFTDERNRLISMLYSSTVPGWLGKTFVEKRIKEKEIPALGIVSHDDLSPGPGVIFPYTPDNAKVPFLDGPDLKRDIDQVRAIYKGRHEDPKMYVFALNGSEVLAKVKRVCL